MASKERTYHEQTNIDYTLRLRELLKTLPPFAKDYFRAIEYTSSIRTRLNYAYDIRVFYHYLIEYNPVYRNYSIEQFQPADLEKLSAVDIEEYMDYLKVYKSDDDALRTMVKRVLHARCRHFGAFMDIITSISYYTESYIARRHA